MFRKFEKGLAECPFLWKSKIYDEDYTDCGTWLYYSKFTIAMSRVNVQRQGQMYAFNWLCRYRCD